MSVNWRYWRFAVDSIQTPAIGYVAIEYLKLSVAAGGASIFTGGVPSASSVAGSSIADRAFIDDAQWWACDYLALPAWVQYDLGAGNNTTARFLEFRAYPPNHGYSPKSFRLQGSNDGSTWTNLLAVEISGYASNSRWVIDSSGTLRIPFGYVVSGNSTHNDTTEVQRVFINNWTTGMLVDSVVPDSAGDWKSVVTGSADVLVTHIGDSGYQPLADGPVTPAAR